MLNIYSHKSSNVTDFSYYKVLWNLKLRLKILLLSAMWSVVVWKFFTVTMLDGVTSWKTAMFILTVVRNVTSHYIRTSSVPRMSRPLPRWLSGCHVKCSLTGITGFNGVSYVGEKSVKMVPITTATRSLDLLKE